MKIRDALTLLGVMAIGLPLHAQVLDTFSTNDSGNYNTTIAYQGGGPAPATFAVNGLGQFQPTGGASDTTIFLRNTGQTLSDTTFGESVTLSLVAVANPATDDGSQLGAGSLGFSTSLTPTAGGGSYATQDFEVGILRLSGAYSIAASNTSIIQASIPVDADFTLGSITETITRQSDTGFSYDFSGPGLIGAPLIGTFTVPLAAGHALYFGPDVFGGNTAGDQIEDNLVFSVPEPSTWALFSLGTLLLAGRLYYRHRATA